MTSAFPIEDREIAIDRAIAACNGSMSRFVTLLPAPERYETTCFYCHRKFYAYVGAITNPNDIVERQMRTGVTEPIAHCGCQECARKDLLRQDTMFILIQREKARHAASAKPGSVDPDSVQGKGKKARVSKGKSGGGEQLPGLVEPVADADGHPSECLPENPFPG